MYNEHIILGTNKLLSQDLFNRFLRFESLNNTILLILLGGFTGIVSDSQESILVGL